jgi:hypothetical protein
MSEAMDALELLPLCRATLPVHEAIVLEGTPMGTLMVGEIRESRWQGERFSARQRGHAAADWLNVTSSGTAIIDVRLTLETDDGALVFVEYKGRSNLTTGIAYCAPTFQTGDARYAWMNDIQAVAKGVFDADAMTLTYPTIYQLR